MKHFWSALFALVAVVLASGSAEAQRPIMKGATDQTAYIRIVDEADGTPETGVVASTSGLDLEYVRLGASPVDLTESDLAATNSAHSDGGIKHVGGGRYRVDLPDAAVASAAGVNEVCVQGTVTGMVVLPTTYPLTAFDVFDAIPTVDVSNIDGAALGTHAGGYMPSDARLHLGTAYLSPITAGLPLVQQIGGRTWYVTTTGNDSNPGTAALPLLTPAAAVAASLPGDTVYIRFGTYTIPATINATLKQGIRILGEGKDLTVLNAGAGVTGVVTLGSASHLRFLTLNDTDSGGIPLAIVGTSAWVDGCGINGSSDSINASSAIKCAVTYTNMSSHWDVCLLGMESLFMNGCSLDSDCTAAGTTDICTGLSAGGTPGVCTIRNTTIDMRRASAASARTIGMLFTGETANLKSSIQIEGGRTSVTGSNASATGAFEAIACDSGGGLYNITAHTLATDAHAASSAPERDLALPSTARVQFDRSLYDPAKFSGSFTWTDISSRVPAALTADGNMKSDALRWAGAATASDDIALAASLAKGTTITGFNDLSAGQVNSEVTDALGQVTVTISPESAQALNEPVLDAIDDIPGGGGGGEPISPTYPGKGMRWRFDSPTQIKSAQILELAQPLDDELVAFDLSGVMADEVSVLSIGTVSISPTAGVTEPTLGTALVSANKREIHVPVTADVMTAGTYTITVTFTTTDDQTKTRKGDFNLQ